MGKKYDAYAKAAQAESQAKQEYAQAGTEETKTNAIQAEINSNLVFHEFLDDPEG